MPLVFRTATVEDVKPRNGQGGAKHSSRFLWTMSVREVRHLFLLSHRAHLYEDDKPSCLLFWLITYNTLQ